MVQTDNGPEGLSGPAEPDEEMALVEKAISFLGNYYDSVQVFVSRYDRKADQTVNIQKGRGNWNARFGQAKLWVSKEEFTFQEEDDEQA